jgi:hypothetical protein
MKKRQKYSNGGGPIKFSDIFKLDGNTQQGVKSTVTTPVSKKVSASATQQDGKNVSTTLNLNLPKTKANITRNKGGNTSGSISKSFGKNSSITANVSRPKGGGSGTYYGITYSKQF